MSYIGWLITESSRKELLELFAPKYENIICHHVTYKFFAKNPENILELLPKTPNLIEVVGYVDTGKLQAFVCSLDGIITRSDGNNYHLTHCLNTESKPADSIQATKNFKTRILNPIKISVLEARVFN